MPVSSKQHRTGKRLQSTILRYLKSHKYIELGLPVDSVVAYKIEVANERGVPDILMCVNGRFVAIEVKGDDDKLSKIQWVQLDRISKAGGLGWIVRDFDMFKDILRIVGEEMITKYQTNQKGKS